MALTHFQRAICRLIAANRVATGESYVAGGVALNEILAAPRTSRDIDLFHDTEAGLEATWAADRCLLEAQGFGVRVLRERPSYVEAQVIRGDESVLMQWTRDSAFRFFPLVEHEDLGLILHPFDLATNKVLAFVGRLEVRDWVDVIQWHAMLSSAAEIVAILPAEEVGKCVLARDGRLFRSGVSELRSALALGAVLFHPGRIRGALPRPQPERGRS